MVLHTVHQARALCEAVHGMAIELNGEVKFVEVRFIEVKCIEVNFIEVKFIEVDLEDTREATGRTREDTGGRRLAW